MTTGTAIRHRAWLPEAALAGEPALRPLAAAVEDWSAHWFAAGELRLVDEPASAAGAIRSARERWSLGGGELVLEAEPAAGRAIAAAMLDAPVDEAALGPCDERLVGRIADSCLADLRRRLGASLGHVESDWAAGDGGRSAHMRSAAVALGGGRTLLRVAVGAQALARLRKASLPPPPPLRLHSVAAALGRQPVAVEALIGRCRLTIGEVGGLAVGDVVVLDAEFGDPVALALDGSPKAARCLVRQEGGQLLLKVSQPFQA